MSKRIFFPTHFNMQTAKAEPQHLVGYTGDGKVVLTAHGRGLALCDEMTHDAAMALARELLSASCDAKRVADRAAGLHEWVSKPLPDGRFEVSYYGHTGIFRTILNSKRRNGHWTGHRCTVCRAEAPEGATMYVFDKSTKKRGVADYAASGLGHHRVCESCMRPDLKAAALGLSLLAAQAGEGAK